MMCLVLFMTIESKSYNSRFEHLAQTDGDFASVVTKPTNEDITSLSNALANVVHDDDEHIGADLYHLFQ